MTANISDGYHTFGELYEHRHRLFIALLHSHPNLAWYSHTHSDGTTMDGWFIAGLTLPTGDITYHLPTRLLGDFSEVTFLEQAPEWDGHTSEDVIERLKAWCGSIGPADRKDGFPRFERSPAPIFEDVRLSIYESDSIMLDWGTDPLIDLTK